MTLWITVIANGLLAYLHLQEDKDVLPPIRLGPCLDSHNRVVEPLPELLALLARSVLPSTPILGSVQLLTALLSCVS